MGHLSLLHCTALFFLLGNQSVAEAALFQNLCAQILNYLGNFERGTSRIGELLINRLQDRLGINVEYGTCDGCFCIREEGEECPMERQPKTNFTDLVQIVRKFRFENQIVLDCDPYNDNNCTTNPALVEGGACIATFTLDGGLGDACPGDWAYSLSTYDGTVEEALSENLYVTHAGPCGVCSSFQDLSVYLEMGAYMKDAGIECGLRGLRDPMESIHCYEELGFTRDCAKIWHFNTEHTSEKCLGVCLADTLLNVDANGPPPLCGLTPCIQCDELLSVPIWSKFAGRTRRNSGLKSNIARPCAELIEIKHENPCSFLQTEFV